MLEVVDCRDLELPASASEWLRQLPGPTVVEVPGRDRSQWRAVSTLVHGNEPSGFLAAFDFLRAGIEPATNLALLVSSVRAARHPPLFNHRQMPGEYDLNRRFGRPTGGGNISPDGFSGHKVSQSEVFRNNESRNRVSQDNVSYNNVSYNNVYYNNVSYNNVYYNNVYYNNVSHNNVSLNPVSRDEVPQDAAFRDNVTELASQIIDYLRARRPRQVVDLHNTSGRGPAFGVIVSDRLPARQLVSLFTSRIILTRLVVGSLMEQDLGCPVVTIECGGAGDQAAHQLAYRGLCRFAEIPDPAALEDPRVTLYRHPVRIEARPGISLDYGSRSRADADITLESGIENFNSAETRAGTRLGWLRHGLTECLRARDEQGRNIIETLFLCRDGELLARRNLQLFMVTGRADIALADCLFYAVSTELSAC